MPPPGAAGPVPLPPGVNAFLGFHLVCVQTKMGGVANPANCSLYFLGTNLGSILLAADLAAPNLVIAGWRRPFRSAG